MSYFTRLIGSLGFGKPVGQVVGRARAASHFRAGSRAEQAPRSGRDAHDDRRETKNTSVNDTVTTAKSARRRQDRARLVVDVRSGARARRGGDRRDRQNSRTVRVHYIVWQSNVSLIVVVLTTALVAILLDEAGGLIWRRRRRARLARRDELAELRARHARSGADGPPTRHPRRLPTPSSERLGSRVEPPQFASRPSTGSRGMQPNEPSHSTQRGIR